MAIIIQEITVEVAKPNHFQALVAKEGDINSRFLKVTFAHNGEKIEIMPTSSARISGSRPDGQSKIFGGEVNNDGTATVPLTAWMLELPGMLTCDVTIVDTEGRKLSSTSFNVKVDAAACDNQDLSVDDSYDILTTIANDAKAILTEEFEKAKAEGWFKGDKGDAGDGADFLAQAGEPGHIANLPFRKNVIGAEIIADKSLVFASGAPAITVNDIAVSNVTVGTEYSVSWAGTEYKCVAKSAGNLYLGNRYLVASDVENTGEPFYIEMSSLGTLVQKNSASAESIRLKISTGGVVEYIKIPKEYLPDNIEAVSKVTELDWDVFNDKTFLVPETTVTTAYDSSYDWCTAALDASFEVPNGKEYTLVVNGEKIPCVSSYSDGIGVIFPVGTIPSNVTSVYAVFCMLGGAAFLSPTEGEYTISLYEENLNPLPVDLLPKGVPYCVDTGNYGKTIFPETTIKTTTAFIPPFLGLVVGNTYVVVFNGKAYTCVAQEVTSNDGTMVTSCVAIGDIYTATNGAMGTGPTGEPFVWAEMEGGTSAMPIGEFSEITIAVYDAGGTKISKLDNRCLDLEWLPVMNDVRGEVLIPETTLVTNADGNVHFPVIPLTIEVGKAYLVVFNGQTYRCVGGDDGDMYCWLGNGARSSHSIKDTGEPFVYRHYRYDDADWASLLWDRANTEITIAVYACEVEPNKIPEKFLPDNLGGSPKQVVFTMIDGSFSNIVANYTFEEVHSWLSAGQFVSAALVGVPDTTYCMVAGSFSAYEIVFQRVTRATSAEGSVYTSIHQISFKPNNSVTYSSW